MRIFNPSAVIFDPKELKGRADKDPTENNVMLCYEWLSKQVKNQQSVDQNSSQTFVSKNPTVLFLKGKKTKNKHDLLMRNEPPEVPSNR